MPVSNSGGRADSLVANAANEDHSTMAQAAAKSPGWASALNGAGTGAVQAAAGRVASAKPVGDGGG